MKKRTLGPQIVFGQESHPPAARAGVAFNKSGRLDLNQRPPAPELERRAFLDIFARFAQ
jgi:hypothetical protein